MIINNFLSKNKTFYFAHRGAPLLKNENTMESFEKAIQLGCDGVEMDIQQTKDHRIIIFHDDYMFYQNKNQYVSQLDYSEIKDICAHENTIVPSLFEDVIPIIYNNPNIIFNLEIKSMYLNNYSMIHAIKSIVPNKLLINQCIISSFNYSLLLQLKFFLKEIFIGFILGSNRLANQHRLFFYKAMIKLLKPTFLHPNGKFINLDFVQWAQNNKIIVNTYIVNDNKMLDQMLNLGVNGIFTDNHKLYSNN